MVFRREKGLCYNCDEKWNANHRCKRQVMLFIADEQLPLPETVELGPEGEQVAIVSEHTESPSDIGCFHT